MAAPLLWLATKVGSRGKAINFLKKLYKGPISGYGEKIAKKSKKTPSEKTCMQNRAKKELFISIFNTF